jgi:hypothetical protein|eukprot:COSAG02_NODE_1237_length_13725_cov_27.071921_4_plen_41_part_00
MLRFIIYFCDRVLPLFKSFNLGAVQQTLSIQLSRVRSLMP